VRDAPRGEEELPGAQRVRLGAKPEGDLALEDEPALALVAVDVQRRLAAGGASISSSAKPLVSALAAWMRARLSRNWTSSLMSCAPWR
jgi:hypothetical protein